MYIIKLEQGRSTRCGMSFFHCITKRNEVMEEKV